MAYGREGGGGGGSSSCALPTSSVGGPRTTTAMTAASSSTTGNHQPQHQPSKQLYTSTNKPYRLNSGRPNPLDSVREEQLLTVGLAGRPLGRDQALKWAKVGGATVNSDFVYQLTTRRTLEKLRRAAGAGADVMTILQEEFAALSPIVPGVYLTGTFGLQKEAFETAKVWVVVNATTELPLLKLPTLLAVRVPVEDDTAHRIDRYFDDVADLMETCRRRGYGSVVHCAAGVSRSAALTLAYLLKYTDLSLLEAFRHTRTVRPVVRPNTGFMEQLVEFERKLRGDSRTSVRMVHVTDEKRRVTVYVPDFYQKEYPELYEREVVKQQEIAAAAASATITPAP
ncbi:PREDICTED: dual specificity protein phosphatase 18-like, partial [Rhagoletis zephyria]|uniref:dual specificity protein phosphatase 18-like n=1 Tax=Rhagoletis zephyria TaxID=28612 RepID=UPI000811992B